MYKLTIANKNYSSWSLRPWILMKELSIPFEEHLIVFGDEPAWDDFKKSSPSGLVPSLDDGQTVVWDSLAITEYLAERHSEIWPGDKDARAWARCAAAEMHSGFSALRSECGMNCGLKVRLTSISNELAADIGRIETLWVDGLTRFGGPFLAGDNFTAVDAFFSAVVFRIQTYGLELNDIAQAYVQRMLALESMQEWHQAGIQETWRDESHEQEIKLFGKITSDIRAVD